MDLHPVVKQALEESGCQGPELSPKGKLPKSMEGNFVLFAHEGVNVGEKLCLRVNGPESTFQKLRNHLYQMRKLCFRSGDEGNLSVFSFIMTITRQNFFHVSHANVESWTSRSMFMVFRRYWLRTGGSSSLYRSSGAAGPFEAFGKYLPRRRAEIAKAALLQEHADRFCQKVLSYTASSFTL